LSEAGPVVSLAYGFYRSFDSRVTSSRGRVMRIEDIMAKFFWDINLSVEFPKTIVTIPTSDLVFLFLHHEVNDEGVA